MLVLLLLGLSYGAFAQTTAFQLQKLVASDRASDDNFGYSVNISGNYAIVGAYLKDENANNPNRIRDAGAAYIFEQDSSTGKWKEVQKLVASDRALGDHFGFSVTISDNYAIVGAHLEDEDATGSNTVAAAGSAYIFERNDSTGKWKEVQKIVASDREVGDQFGNSVSIFGNYVIVGAHEEDDDANDTNSVATAGSAYIYKRDSSTDSWIQVQKIVASVREVGDQFGTSVSISGNYAIVGAHEEDDDANDSNKAGDAGSAYIFERDSSTGSWKEVKKIVASDRGSGAHFGWSVSISGSYAIVGARHEGKDAHNANYTLGAGAAYIFERNSSTDNWKEVQKIVASDRASIDRFGWSVSISGGYAIVGAPWDDEDMNNTILASYGSAYIFERNSVSGKWKEVQKIVASVRAWNDYFGYAVSISDNHVLVGVYREDEDETDSNIITDAGAAYIFEIDTSCTSLTTSFSAYDTCKGTTPRFVDNSTGINRARVIIDTSSISYPVDSIPASAFLNAGSYKLTFIAYSTTGCTDTQEVKVRIIEAPQARFTINSICLGEQNFGFQNTSTGIDSLTDYSIRIQGTGVDTTLVDTFDLSDAGLEITPGAYTFTLTATNALGCSSSYSQSIHVNALPDTGFSLSINELSVSADAAANGAASYNWSWGDGDSGTGDTANHTYDTTGTYTITLSTTSDSGCTSITTRMVYVELIGIAGMASSEGLNVYPNPVQPGQRLRVDLPAGITTANAVLVDAAGRVVAQERVTGSQATLTAPAVAGVYTLQLHSATGVAVGRVVVK